MVRFAHQLKDEIRNDLGFTVNIGISTNFLLSKMAGDFSKPDKVHTLFPDEIEEKMWPLPVSELLFVTNQKICIETVIMVTCLYSAFTYLATVNTVTERDRCCQSSA